MGNVEIRWDLFLIVIILVVGGNVDNILAQDMPVCSQVQIGQYNCTAPETDGNTDSLIGCRPDGTLDVSCTVIDGVICSGDRNFTIQSSCLYTNGYSFSTALTLSIFLGTFGIDRFYLGYPTIGLFKLFTFGGFLVGNWIDIILIATQTLLPADGSNYVIKINGPRLTHFSFNNATYQVPQDQPF